jgi:hypothetical protein
MDNDLKVTINQQLGRWNRVPLELRVVHVLLALTGIVCPLIVASFADVMSTLQTRLLSFAAGAAVAVFSGFDIGHLATRFREAWKLLNAARLDYEQGHIDGKKLTGAYREGERIIGQLKANPFAKERIGG